jgi:hypothetical protein
MRGTTVLALGVCGLPLLAACGPVGTETGEGAEPIDQVSEAVIPAIPTLVSPNTTIQCKPNFVWNAVSGADNYELWVKDPGLDPRILATYTDGQTQCNDGVGTCNITPGVPAVAAGAGTFFVRASNVDGVSGWSTGMNFTINTPGQAENVSPPVNGAGPTNPTFQWKSADGVEVYRLWVETAATPPVKVIDVSPTVAESNCPGGPPQTCSFQPVASLTPGTSYRWQIMTWNSTNFIGCWTDLTLFTVAATGLGPATLISPNGATTNPVTFTWFAVAAATQYRLWVNDGVTNKKVNQIVTATQAGCSAGTGQCSFTIATTLDAGTGRWWIQSQNATTTNNGPWSAPMNFTIGSIGQATLVSPTGAAGTNTPTYTWNAVAGASVYRLWVTDSGASPRIDQTLTATQAGCAAGTGTCSVTPTTALASGSASWWVQANGGPWSTPLSFTVP